MKKTISVLCFVLLLSLLFPSFCFAEGGNYDTLADWNIRIAVPDNATAVLKGSEYYIYAQRNGYIPYVMLKAYRYESEEAFLTDFTEYMKGQYSDLKVSSEAERKLFGNKKCYEIDYTYTVSGYDVTDRRVVKMVNGLVYMFASKEIPSNGMTVGSMLDDVVANCEFLSGSEGVTEPTENAESASADAYLYTLENGMPKYWLDFSGVMSDNPVLHCFFRSGDPTFYESCYILDLSTAEFGGGAIRIHQISDEYGFDHSDWFRNFEIRFSGDEVIMVVDRDVRTLAGGGEDNVLTGTYVMRPVGVGVTYELKDRELLLPCTYLRPEHDGPYTAEELGTWAQIDYFERFGFFPPIADVEKNPDGTFSVHLYEIVNLGEISHTATSAWYTIDAFGVGSNDITGESVDLKAR